MLHQKELEAKTIKMIEIMIPRHDIGDIDQRQ